MKLTMNQAKEAIIRDIEASFYSVDGKYSTPKITGQPGIGKSSIATSVAKEINGTAQSLNAQILEKGDIIGIPYKKENKDDGETYVEFVKHYIFKHINELILSVEDNLSDSKIETLAKDILNYSGKDKKELANLIVNATPSQRKKLFEHKGLIFTPSVLLIDEINRGDEGVRKEMMNILLDRTVNGFNIPWFVFLIAAANPIGFGLETSALDLAQENRFKSFDVYAELEEWISDYAVSAGINDLIIEFLANHDELFTLPEDRLKRITGSFPTPRSWTAVHTDLERSINLGLFDPATSKFVDPQYKRELLIDISGRVGDLAAETFIGYLEERENFVSVADVFSNSAVKSGKVDDLTLQKVIKMSDKSVRLSYFTTKLVNHMTLEYSNVIDNEDYFKVLQHLYSEGLKSDSVKNLFSKLVASTFITVNDKRTLLYIYMLNSKNQNAKDFAKSLGERSQKLGKLIEELTK